MMVISVLAFVPVRLGAMVLTTYSAMKKTMALSECPTISNVLKRVSGHVPEDRGGPISMDAPYATLVFDGATAALDACQRDSRDPCNRTRSCFPDLAAAATARRRGLERAGFSAADPAYRQL